jgi:GNAT superfamily N-acetyltransferase
MESSSEAKIVDITRSGEYEAYLYRCLAPMPFRRYGKRQRYLEEATLKGFHKAILLFEDDVVGQIEYAPAAASGLPISGDDIVVMNCIWVLRRAKGHAFGRLLLNHMTKAEADAAGFSTLALEGHPSGWLKRWQMEWLGFKPIDSVKMRHKTKRRDVCFEVFLMWLPRLAEAKPPSWDRDKLLEGVDFCMAHPLYHPESLKTMKQIYDRC